MPEYMTKCEPVDKKPYIVYTTEKGILYSGDPNADIPGGGGGDATEYNIVCYEFGENDQLVQTDDIYALGEWDAEQHDWKPSGNIVTKANAGDVLTRYTSGLGVLTVLLSEPSMDGIVYPHDTRGGKSFVMPAHDVCAVISK